MTHATQVLESARPAAAPPRPKASASLPGRRSPAPAHELAALATRHGAALEIGPPDDGYEREAERVAERVTATPEGGPLRRTCACGGTPGPDGECAACRAKRLALQARAAPGVAGGAASAIVHEVLAAPGRPLDGGTRAFFEPRLGADLSAVRTHTGARAATSARAVGALAYTVGSDVVFAVGRYAPATRDGRRLLAHELAHVLQQRGGPAALWRQTPPAIASTCNTESFDPATQQCCDDRVLPGAAAPASGPCKQLTTRDNEYDGCSVPDSVPREFVGVSKDNPGGAYDTWFSDPTIHGTQIQSFRPSLPCDVHDKCFQTCGANMKACNDALFLAARAVCQNSRQRPGSYAYDQCMYAVNLAEVGLPQGSQGPFDQRQREYCACCQPGPGRGNAASPPIDFLTGKTELDDQAKTVIHDFLTAHQFVLAGTAYTLTLQGQASRLGDDQRNQELSDKRVAAVRAEIEKQLKMVGGNIVVASLGEQLAALEAPADPDEDAQAHRTVEIILVWP